MLSKIYFILSGSLSITDQIKKKIAYVGWLMSEQNVEGLLLSWNHWTLICIYEQVQ